MSRPVAVVALLDQLGYRREAVLVIVDGTLVTGDATIAEGSTGRGPPRRLGRGGVRCRVCRKPAVIDVRRHNAGFCPDCFLDHCRHQVEV